MKFRKTIIERPEDILNEIDNIFNAYKGKLSYFHLPIAKVKKEIGNIKEYELINFIKEYGHELYYVTTYNNKMIIVELIPFNEIDKTVDRIINNYHSTGKNSYYLSDVKSIINADSVSYSYSFNKRFNNETPPFRINIRYNSCYIDTDLIKRIPNQI